MPDEKTLQAKILSWLNTQGYPLEMKVARAFQSSGFRVTQSDYYTDVETGESREIDVLASLQEQVDELLLRITVVGECKSSKEKPWVLFSSRDCTISSPARVAQRAASSLGRRVLHQLAQEKEIQALPIFMVPEVPAYSLTQAFTSGHDVCYAAATAVADAAVAIATAASERNSGIRRTKTVEIIFPAIITDARLFSASIEADDSVTISEIESGVLLWRNPLVGVPHTIIHVISLNALDDFVATTLASTQKILGMLSGSHRGVLDAVLKREQIMNGLKS